MAEPIRVLHVLGRLNMGGAESRIMDLYRHMDREQVQFDFLVHYRLTDEDRRSGAGTDTDTLLRLRPAEDFDEEACALGARIYVLPRFTGTNLHEYQKACRAFFAGHHGWAAIEGHMTSMASVYLPIAKEAGVPVTIAHARSAGVDAGIRGIATRIFRRSLPERCDIMMSCSRPASVSVFGEKVADSGKIMMVPNALDLSAFHYDAALRRQMRTEYGIPEDAFVIGHVGRFDAVKNQAFLARVGSALRQPGKDDSSAAGAAAPEGKTVPLRFLFVGEGRLRDDVLDAFAGAGLADQVIFAGLQPRERTAALYQAFDLFTLPSLYEGLPGTVIEAQSAGLPCVIADTITEEVALTDLVTRLPLADPAAWARIITARMQTGTDRQEQSEQALRILTDAGYEIKSAAARMQTFYTSLANR